MQNERNRGVRTGVVVVAGLDPTGRTVDIHFRHELLTSIQIWMIGRCHGAFERMAPNAAAKLDFAAQETYTT